MRARVDYIDDDKSHPIRSYDAIVATNDRGNAIALCEIRLGEAVYPAIIEYGRRIVSCHSRNDFEQAVVELLEDPTTGEKVFSLLNSTDD
ncbi:hypothetical protein [Lacunimicrobium album]